MRAYMSLQRYDFTTNNTLDTERKNTERYRYFEFMISEANIKLDASQAKLVFIKSIFDIDHYLQDHPNETRIGFVVEKPDCIKSTNMQFPDTHVSPIYFERQQDVETFVQFDSALGQIFLLPQNKNTKRRIYYSPDLRQVTRQGCFEDAVIILMKLLRSNGIVAYCEKNSQNKFEALATPLTSSELDEQNKLEIQSSTVGILFYSMSKFTILSRRLEYQKQLAVLQQQHLKPVENIYVLTAIPKILIPHIERFDTMRNIRVMHPEQFDKPMVSGQTLLTILLKNGVLRTKDVSSNEVRKNLTDSNSRYDFAGASFLSQREAMRTAQTERCKNIYRLFYRKLASEKIANKITELSTGKRFGSVYF
jgi:hypothetical protein